MDEVPDEHLAEVGPLAKKIAKALDLVDYNSLQVCPLVLVLLLHKFAAPS